MHIEWKKKRLQEEKEAQLVSQGLKSGPAKPKPDLNFVLANPHVDQVRG
jgi:hypothetical protein